MPSCILKICCINVQYANTHPHQHSAHTCNPQLLSECYSGSEGGGRRLKDLVVDEHDTSNSTIIRQGPSDVSFSAIIHNCFLKLTQNE